MKLDKNATLEELPRYVDYLDTVIPAAESQLQAMAKVVENPSQELRDEVQTALDRYTNIAQDGDILLEVFSLWQAEQLSPLQKAEVERALGYTRRLRLVTKNILRIARKYLGIPDPERAQEEAQVQLMMMSRMTE